jgi:hypothetical protein
MSTTELVVSACLLWSSGFTTSVGVQLASRPIPRRYHVLGIGLLGTALWVSVFATDLVRK